MKLTQFMILTLLYQSGPQTIQQPAYPASDNIVEYGVLKQCPFPSSSQLICLWVQFSPQPRKLSNVDFWVHILLVFISGFLGHQLYQFYEMGSLGICNNLTMVCAPLMAHSVEQVVCDMNKAKAQGADIVEIRLDLLQDFQASRDLQLLLRNKPLPVIVVYRPESETGTYDSEEKRLEALYLARELGADYIEVELKVASEHMRVLDSSSQKGSKMIVSCYLEEAVPNEDDLSKLVSQMQSTGADIIKLVTNALDITEISRTFSLLSNIQVPLIAYSTGERGLISQILCPKFGGFMVYGSLEGHSVPGLPSLESLKHHYMTKHIDYDTKVFGLVSKPVSHSKGPILHNPTLRYEKYNGVYVPMFVDDLKRFFSVYSSPDFAGFSVGIPYKEAVIGFCDQVDPLAQEIGAVNTIIRRQDGKLVGHNTDCEAAISSIEDALLDAGSRYACQDASPLKGRMFFVVGAGGAGRALAFGAKTRGSRIIVSDIDYDRAKSLAHAVAGEAIPFEDVKEFQPEKGAILANATPLGMHPSNDRIPVAEETFRDYELVFDSVYSPRKTRLLKEAEAAGAITVSGVEMFYRQAVGQFKLFTGKQVAPEEFMREIVMSKF